MPDATVGGISADQLKSIGAGVAAVTLPRPLRLALLRWASRVMAILNWSPI